MTTTHKEDSKVGDSQPEEGQIWIDKGQTVGGEHPKFKIKEIREMTFYDGKEAVVEWISPEGFPKGREKEKTLGFKQLKEDRYEVEN